MILDEQGINNLIYQILINDKNAKKYSKLDFDKPTEYQYNFSFTKSFDTLEPIISQIIQDTGLIIGTLFVGSIREHIIGSESSMFDLMKKAYVSHDTIFTTTMNEIFTLAGYPDLSTVSINTGTTDEPSLHTKRPSSVTPVFHTLTDDELTAYAKKLQRVIGSKQKELFALTYLPLKLDPKKLPANLKRYTQ